MDAYQKAKFKGYLIGIGFTVAFTTVFVSLMAGSLWLGFIAAFASGVPGATAIVAIESELMPRFKRLALIWNVLVRGLLYLLAFAMCFPLGIWMAIWARSGASPFAPEVIEYVPVILMTPQVMFGFSTAIVMVMLVGLVLNVSRKLGPGVMRNLILGRYHHPREETRIFMFLDMKDSTTLAERLGELKFSALVRDFFEDMTRPLLETKAEVSHYIGDEAVITWNPRRGLNNANCIRLFELMRETIEARAEHYTREYGVVPDFKAGAHLGVAVVTEVGEVKSEIVFHGDTVNTAARIVGLCSSLDHDFLASGELVAALGRHGAKYESAGVQELKGKERTVEVFKVHLS